MFLPRIVLLFSFWILSKNKPDVWLLLVDFQSFNKITFCQFEWTQVPFCGFVHLYKKCFKLKKIVFVHKPKYHKNSCGSLDLFNTAARLSTMSYATWNASPAAVSSVTWAPAPLRSLPCRPGSEWAMKKRGAVAAMSYMTANRRRQSEKGQSWLMQRPREPKNIFTVPSILANVTCHMGQPLWLVHVGYVWKGQM